MTPHEDEYFVREDAERKRKLAHDVKRQLVEAEKARLKALHVGEAGEWPAWAHAKDRGIPGRLIAVKRGRQAARWARRRLRRKAQRKQKRLSEQALFLAGYVFVWTTIPAGLMDSAQVLELYRARWQIEPAFRRMKSIMGLGQLPKLSEASARAWLHGKLFIALLIERLLDAAEHFSPWGYRLDAEAEPVARGALSLS